MTPPRVVVVTGHEFGAAALRGLVASQAYQQGDFEIPLVVTLAQTRREQTVGFFDGQLPQGRDVQTISTANGRLTDMGHELRAARPTFLLVVGWSYLVPDEVLNIPAEIAGEPNRHSRTHGAVGMHPTLLPIGRGRAPIPWAILRDERETGLSVFRLEEGADTGAIIWQRSLPIGTRETSSSLFSRIKELHEAAGLDLANLIASGTVIARDQDDRIATEWQRRRPQDAEIFATMTVDELDRLIRASTRPYPPAYIELASGRFHVEASISLESSVSERTSEIPVGAVVNEGSGSFLDIRTAEGIVRLWGCWRDDETSNSISTEGDAT